jgi:hypothetical protein
MFGQQTFAVAAHLEIQRFLIQRFLEVLEVCFQYLYARQRPLSLIVRVLQHIILIHTHTHTHTHTCMHVCVCVVRGCGCVCVCACICVCVCVGGWVGGWVWVWGGGLYRCACAFC